MQKKHSGKYCAIFSIIIVLCAVLIYIGSDQLLLAVRKPSIEAFARNYVSRIEKINTYGDDFSSKAKENQLTSFYNDYFLKNANNDGEFELIKKPMRDMQTNGAKIEKFSADFIKVESMRKIPFTFHYDVTIKYKLDWKYEGKALCFDGSGASSFYKDESANGEASENCRLSFEVRKTGGKYKISKISVMESNA